MNHLVNLLILLLFFSCNGRVKINDDNHNMIVFMNNTLKKIENNVEKNKIKVLLIDSLIHKSNNIRLDSNLLNKYLYKIDWNSYYILKKNDSNLIFFIIDSLAPIENYQRILVLEKRFCKKIDIRPYFALHLISMKNGFFVSSILLSEELKDNSYSRKQGALLYSDTLLIRCKTEVITSDVQEINYIFKPKLHSIKKITNEVYLWDKKSGIYTFVKNQ